MTINNLIQKIAYYLGLTSLLLIFCLACISFYDAQGAPDILATVGSGFVFFFLLIVFILGILFLVLSKKRKYLGILLVILASIAKINITLGSKSFTWILLALSISGALFLMLAFTNKVSVSRLKPKTIILMALLATFIVLVITLKPGLKNISYLMTDPNNILLNQPDIRFRALIQQCVLIFLPIILIGLSCWKKWFGVFVVIFSQYFLISSLQFFYNTNILFLSRAILIVSLLFISGALFFSLSSKSVSSQNEY